MTTAASAALPPDPDVSTPSSVTGCPDLDARVLHGRQLTEAGGLVVGISADGDVGLVMALSVVVSRLRRDPAATARLVTTLPAAHVVRLLRDAVVRSTSSIASSPSSSASSAKELRANVLRRVLVSRIYGHDELAAVLDELEGGVPFQRLWSASQPGAPSTAEEKKTEDGRPPPVVSPSPVPSVIVFTEMDHHFKWMRLQGSSGDGPGDNVRLHAQYGQLLRRLRGLATLPSSLASTTPSIRAPLVLVLNGTFVRTLTNDGGGRDAAAAAAAPEDATSPTTPAPRGLDDDSNTQLALALLQQPQQSQQPLATATVRLCCEELARAQHVEPRYHGLMNYLCSLHVCCTRLPSTVARLVEAKVSSAASALSASSLWVVTVENDEQEISHTTGDRIGVVRFAHGTLHDMLSG